MKSLSFEIRDKAILLTLQVINLIFIGLSLGIRHFQGERVDTLFKVREVRVGRAHVVGVGGQLFRSGRTVCAGPFPTDDSVVVGTHVAVKIDFVVRQVEDDVFT